MQLTAVEDENENLLYRVKNLSCTLQQNRLESERRVVLLQQQHEDKIHIVMTHLASDGGDARRLPHNIFGMMIIYLIFSTLFILFFIITGKKGIPIKVGGTSKLLSRIIPKPDVLQTGPHAKMTKNKNKLIFQQTMK